MRASRPHKTSIGSAIGSLVDSHLKDRAGLVRIRELSRVAATTSALIHELQKERGLSSGFVAGAGRGFSQDLPEQRLRTDHALAEASEAWSSIASGARFGTLESAMGEARASLVDLPRFRADIHVQALTPNAVVQLFSTIIDRLLVVIAEVPGTSPHPQVTMALIALFNFLLAKEYTGQVRALGSAVCAQSGFEPFQFERFQTLLRQKDESLGVFVRHLGKEQWDRWTRLQETTNFRALDALLVRLEKLGRGQGTAPAALDWFQAVTDVIDDMRRYEVRQLDELDRLCFQVFAEAGSAWEDSQETPEERDRLFLARLERTHLRLQEERLQTRLADLGTTLPLRPGTPDELATMFAHDSVRAVEEAHRWRKDIERWVPVVQELAESSRRAKLLSLDASINAVRPAEVARSAEALARRLMALAEQLESRVAELRSSADQSVDSFETLHADALQLQKLLLLPVDNNDGTKT